jgi:hypothetical protein
MIAFDTTALSALWVPGSPIIGRSTKKPIKHAKERLDLLIEEIAGAGEVIVIPAPSLSEVLVKIPKRIDEHLKILKGSRWFDVVAFDTAAAVELALRTAAAIESGDKREGLSITGAKIKFDRQIISVAIVSNATQIISDDADVAALGARWGFTVTSIEDLPVPSELIPPPLLRAMEEEEPPSTKEADRKSKNSATE